jgi:hypothetical protein
MPAVRSNPKIVTRAEHAIIQAKLKLNGTQDYAVVIQKGKGFWNKSIHVFSRQPSTRELQTFEESSSRLKFKGQKAEMEGSPIAAASELYNRLIDRAHDVLIGLQTHEQLNSQQCRDLIPPLVKREAIREFTAEVYSASRMEEAEGVSEGADEAEADEDNPEAHTSATPQD